MKYDFDRVIDRQHSDSHKWAYNESLFGVKDALSLWVADMDFESPAPVIAALERRAQHGVFGYPHTSPEFFNAIVGWMKRRHHWDIKPTWIATTPGIVAALVMAVRAFSRPGDKVIVQTPVYHPFMHIANNNGRQLVFNSLKIENGRYTMDFDDLEKKMDNRTRLLILCSPHNPIGRVWTRAELERLGEICARHNVLILSDEIHHDLVFQPHQHIPTASISDAIANITLTFAAPSKTFNIPGLASAYVIASNPQLLARYKVEQENAGLLGGNIFGIAATEAAYCEGDEWLDQLLVYLQGNIDFTMDYIAKHIPQIKMTCPEGTYLFWLDCRGLGLDDAGIQKLLRQQARVILNDGIMFGAEGAGFQRLNAGCPRATLAEGLKRMADAIQNLAKVG